MFTDIEQGSINPAAIINGFEDVEEQRMAAEVFNTKLEAIETKAEWEKAFHDILLAVKRASFEYYSDLMGSDIAALNEAIAGKKALEALERVHISID